MRLCRSFTLHYGRCLLVLLALAWGVHSSSCRRKNGTRNEDVNNSFCVQNLTCLFHNNQFNISWQKSLNSDNKTIDYLVSLKENDTLLKIEGNSSYKVILRANFFGTFFIHSKPKASYTAIVKRRQSQTEGYTTNEECTPVKTHNTKERTKQKTTTRNNQNITAKNENSRDFNTSNSLKKDESQSLPSTYVIIGSTVAVLTVLCCIICIALKRKDRNRSSKDKTAEIMDNNPTVLSTTGSVRTKTSNLTSSNLLGHESQINEIHEPEEDTYNHLSRWEERALKEETENNAATYSHIQKDKDNKTLTVSAHAAGLGPTRAGGQYDDIPFEHFTGGRFVDGKVYKMEDEDLSDATTRMDTEVQEKNNDVSVGSVEAEDIVRKSGPKGDLYTDVTITKSET